MTIGGFELDPRWLTGLGGVVLLLFGRRLYPLLLWLVGFAVGWWLVARTGVAGVSFPSEINVVGLVVAALAGVLCATLAVFVQRVATLVAGFVIGGAAGLWAVSFYGLRFGGLEWLLILGAAVFCALLLRIVFNVALAVLSSGVGALLVAQAAGWQGRAVPWLLLGLTAVGTAVQLGSRRGRREGRRRTHGDRGGSRGSSSG